MKVIIIEDEFPCMEFLKNLLMQYCEGIEIVASVSNIKDAVKAINKHQPALVFLDIELPGQDGFSLFDYFDDINFGIIFTTAYQEYAIQALRLSAIDYLMKPIDLEELMSSVERARTVVFSTQSKSIKALKINLNTDDNSRIALKVNDGFSFYKSQEILYCKADGRYTIFYFTNGKKIIISQPLKEFELILRNFGFIRIHRSHIINPLKITQFVIGKNPIVVLEHQIKLMVSQTKRKELEHILSLS